MTLDEFRDALATAVADELAAAHPRLADEEMRGFDLGCMPWHGYLELSFLTADEDPIVDEDPTSEIASWRLYNFAKGDTGQWPRGAALEQWLLEADRKIAKEQIFAACAEALRSPEVIAALEAYRRRPGFICTVMDPDAPDLGDYVGGGQPEWP